VPHGVGCEYPEDPTGVPPRCSVLTAHWGVPRGLRRERCAACDMQANTGGLVHIYIGGTGNVSVIGSTLAITVRA
jgi:hypothetical protein